MGFFKIFLLKHIEFLFWIAALLLLFFMNIRSAADSLCLFHWLGFDHCPGCGIGHSIHSALHMDFTESFRQHPLGMVAVLIILNRIKQLSFSFKQLIS